MTKKSNDKLTDELKERIVKSLNVFGDGIKELCALIEKGGIGRDDIAALLMSSIKGTKEIISAMFSDEEIKDMEERQKTSQNGQTIN